MRRDVFQAIADPTRRTIIQLVAKAPLNLNAVAEHFEVSRPAISKHIKILTECGLVLIKKQGRQRICEARLRPLQDVARWIEQYRVFWNARLDALDSFLATNATVPAAKKISRGMKSRSSPKTKKK